MKKPRLTDHDRLRIEEGLHARKSVYVVAKELGRPQRTIMREIKGRAMESEKGSFGRVANRCIHKMTCTRKGICTHCAYDQGTSLQVLPPLQLKMSSLCGGCLRQALIASICLQRLRARAQVCFAQAVLQTFGGPEGLSQQADRNAPRSQYFRGGAQSIRRDAAPAYVTRPIHTCRGGHSPRPFPSQCEDRLPLCQWRVASYEARRSATRLHAQAPQGQAG